MWLDTKDSLQESHFSFLNKISFFNHFSFFPQDASATTNSAELNMKKALELCFFKFLAQITCNTILSQKYRQLEFNIVRYWTSNLLWLY